MGNEQGGGGRVKMKVTKEKNGNGFGKQSGKGKKEDSNYTMYRREISVMNGIIMDP